MTVFSDLLNQMQASDFVASVKSFATSLGLIPADWVAFDPEDAIVNSVGSTLATWWNTYVWTAINGGFLDTAKKVWLTKLAKNVFNVDRIVATFASGGWTGTNATGSPLGPFNPGDLLFYNLDTNATYRNTQTVTFAPGANAPTPIQADVLGTGSNAAPTRVALLTTVLGLSGSNALSIAAFDDETDAALVARCRLKFYSLSPNGPSQAYQYVALTSSLNGGVSVNRTAVSPSSTGGYVTMYIAGPNGPVASGDVTTVNNALYGVAPTPGGVVPDTVNLSLSSAVAHSIPVTWTAYYHASANVTPTTEVANGNAALTAYFSSTACPIGGDAIVAGSGNMFVNKLIAVIAAACPLAFDIVIAAPAADVPIQSYEVPTLGATSGTATVVA